MAYLGLIAATLMWSLVGLLIKFSAVMVNSHVISFARFAFGVVFLLGLMAVQKIPIRLNLLHPLIWVGVIGKAVNYAFENFGVSLGNSYANIIVLPVQTVALFLFAVLVLKESLTFLKTAAALSALAGMFLIHWAGRSPGSLLAHAAGDGKAMDVHLLVTVLMIISGIGAAAHVISQKKLIEKMDSGNLNLSVFLLASFVTAAPLPLVGEVTGPFRLSAMVALVVLGLITGLSFYLFALALKKIPMIPIAIISNLNILFMLLWSKLFFHDAISIYVMAGALLCLAGIVLVNLPGRRSAEPGVQGCRKTD